MGKDRQEDICFKNLQSGIGGKYVSRKLKDFRTAVINDAWKESPDFLAIADGKALAVEHFVIDQLYIENRAADRVVDERVWGVYGVHHEALINNVFNAEAACADIENELQYALDMATQFDYDNCMDQFDRVFNKHAKKIPTYLDNLQDYQNKDLFFLIEVSSLQIERYSNIIKCLATRNDGGQIKLCGNNVIITQRMIDIVKSQIGVLKGIVFQNYSYVDLNKQMRDMLYLDLSSVESLEESIKAQKIDIYKSFHIYAPKINLKFDLK